MISNKFSDLLGNKNERLYTADDIQHAFDANKTVVDVETHQTRIEIPDFDSDKFKWLVSFFLQTTGGAIQEPDWEKIRSFIKELGTPIRHDVSFFWFGDLSLSH